MFLKRFFLPLISYISVCISWLMYRAVFWYNIIYVLLLRLEYIILMYDIQGGLKKVFDVI